MHVDLFFSILLVFVANRNLFLECNEICVPCCWFQSSLFVIVGTRIWEPEWVIPPLFSQRLWDLLDGYSVNTCEICMHLYAAVQPYTTVQMHCNNSQIWGAMLHMNDAWQ
jgi:hypothetical protein